MRSKTDDVQKDCVIRDWTDDAIVHPLKQVGSDIVILTVFAGMGLLVGALGAIQFVRNRVTK